ncbi:uncharacterized protein LOC127276934 isoform X2 [Leptopilina boulardi]|uniref:uncharacterized protein LOC127276934 isoform X2 n=1 Tax=Leptopilina boulardi TaxID=63433 RepID=UPI0021F61A97|nr:uncharacterized protein LOC127276934 isoform X2 [Leptopilina boulardi]
MGKVAEKLRTYRKDWESMPWAKGWLTKADEKFYNEAYCKICEKDLRAHRADLEKHTKSVTHVRKMASITEGKQSKLSSTVQVTFSEFDKVRDLKISAFIATHTSINSVDHLCDLLVHLGKNTLFDNFKMHRTKCGNLIKNVISPCMLIDLIDDIGDKSFSLIVDESTDVSTFKYLCLCVKYFSEKIGRIITDYLGIIVLERATADALYNAVVDYCDDIKLKLENLVGIGTDGGSNLCGKNHSLYALLKKKYNRVQLLKCINHAIDNVASKSATEFPANIDFLCREVYKWFSHSSLRKIEYRRTYEL